MFYELCRHLNYAAEKKSLCLDVGYTTWVRLSLYFCVPILYRFFFNVVILTHRWAGGANRQTSWGTQSPLYHFLIRSPSVATCCHLLDRKDNYTWISFTAFHICEYITLRYYFSIMIPSNIYISIVIFIHFLYCYLYCEGQWNICVTCNI